MPGPFSTLSLPRKFAAGGVPTAEQEALQDPAFNPPEMLAAMGGLMLAPGMAAVPALRSAIIQQVQGALFQKLLENAPQARQTGQLATDKGSTNYIPGSLAGNAPSNVNETRHLGGSQTTSLPSKNDTNKLTMDEFRESLGIRHPSQAIEPSPFSYPHGAGLGATESFERNLKKDSSGSTSDLGYDPTLYSPRLPGKTEPIRGYGPWDKNVRTDDLAPFDKLYHGLNVWGGNPSELKDKLSAIKEQGLQGGWFSREPHEGFEGPNATYLAVAPKHLPKILTQKRVYEGDPPVELIPDWHGGSGKELGLEHLGQTERKDLLEKMGALSRGEPGQGISVHPYFVWLADRAGKLIERLGLKRAGEKATELLPDVEELLKKAPKE